MSRKTQKCCQCDKPSLPGLRKGQGLCRYHWNYAHWGKEWADKIKEMDACEPERAYRKTTRGKPRFEPPCCPVGDPDCLGADGDCHDACVSPAG